ncbi:unnamed protein product, partial [Strongylus vulgaris]
MSPVNCGQTSWFVCICVKKNERGTFTEPLLSLPLGMALHLNACFAPFLFIAEISCLILKYPYLPVTYKVILVAVLFVYILVEIVRLFLGIVGNLGEKYPYLPVTYKVILVAVLFVYMLVEIVRLFLGIVGNLGEKIPALSGFWTLTLVLQLPIHLFLVFNLAVAPVPLETVML